MHVEVVLRCLGGVNITTPATRTDSTGYGRGGHFVGASRGNHLVGYRMIAQSVGDLVAGLLLNLAHHSVMSRDGWCSLGDPMADGFWHDPWSGTFLTMHHWLGNLCCFVSPGLTFLSHRHSPSQCGLLG